MNYRDKLERSVSLIPATGALSAEDRAALVHALESLAGQHSDKLESPELKKRVAALTEIQAQLKELETKFFEERAALKARQKSFQEKGYNFRLYTLEANDVLAKEITDQDEEALKFLQDIKCCGIGNSKGFKIEFLFNPNPCFENAVLMKTYHMTNDNEPILERAIGTEIKWYPGKILTENSQSFFNFFQPLQVADVQSRIHRDYEIFKTIRDEVIPQWPQEKRNKKGLIGFTSKEAVLKRIFLGERAVLEGKYQKLFEPLYKMRYEIVNGTTEVQETKKGTAVDQEGDKAREEKGVPNFWATAMKNDEVLAQKITKRDEGALKYLKDIKCCRINNSMGFKLEFFFDPNPYFKNTVLTKAYHMTSDCQPVLEKTIGTKMNWHPGKSLTPGSLLKKPRKRSKTADFMTKQQSFFNFFNTPEYPGVPCDYTTYMHHDNFQNIEAQFEVQKDLDHQFGKIIRDKIIPHAVSLFTGEAVDRGTDCDDLDDDDDLNDDYYSDEDDEEEEEEEAVEQHTYASLAY